MGKEDFRNNPGLTCHEQLAEDSGVRRAKHEKQPGRQEPQAHQLGRQQSMFLPRTSQPPSSSQTPRMAPFNIIFPHPSLCSSFHKSQSKTPETQNSPPVSKKPLPHWENTTLDFLQSKITQSSNLTLLYLYQLIRGGEVQKPPHFIKPL